MFCPKCRAEFRKGFSICSDCEIPLVDELPPEASPEPEPKPEYIDYAHLLSTYNLADIALIKSVLDGEDIVYYFQGESFTYLMVQPTKLMVSKDDIERAKELIDELELQYRYFS
jgi:Putative prokaryotic signal transducing protein